MREFFFVTDPQREFNKVKKTTQWSADDLDDFKTHLRSLGKDV